MKGWPCVHSTPFAWLLRQCIVCGGKGLNHPLGVDWGAGTPGCSNWLKLSSILLCDTSYIKLRWHLWNSKGKFTSGSVGLLLWSRTRVGWNCLYFHVAICHYILQVIPDDYISSILKTCSSNSYEQLEVAVKDMLREGYSAMQVISQVSTHSKYGERELVWLEWCVWVISRLLWKKCWVKATDSRFKIQIY